jgi:16S rRNA (cytosine967-C5)-methyltransferase
LAGSRSASPARRRAVATLSEFFSGDRRPLSLAEGTANLAELERDFARELILGVLRNRARLDAEIAGVSRFPLERLQKPMREILEVGLFQIRFLDRIPVRAAVHETVEMARTLAGEGASRLANGVLRSLLRDPPPPASEEDPAGLAVAFSHPEFLVNRWIDRFGLARTRAVLAADNCRSKLTLLCDPRLGTREEIAQRLRNEQVESESSPISSLGLSVISGNPVRTVEFEEGAFYIADAGSQVLPGLIPAGPLLADLAAAPGGKTVAALFSRRFPKVISLDRSLWRLSFLRENRRRLSLEDSFIASADLADLPLRPHSIPRVLLDAPCSGTGTMRKNPEIRYRVTPESIARLAHAQLAMLQAASDAVAPGGYLLYSTCSLEHEENEGVVARFLEIDRGFEPAEIDAPPELAPFVAGHCFRIFPDQGSDGFTAHLLRRR